MAELQRSVTSFRRQGSSGLVWNDRFLSAFQEPNNNQTNPNHPQQPPDNLPPPLNRSRSAGARPYRAVHVALPPKDPPSPKVPTCGLCGFFSRQTGANHYSSSKSKKRR